MAKGRLPPVPRQPIRAIDPICAECSKLAKWVTGEKVYPDHPNLWEKPYWLCECGAYVGCHPGTDIPLGFPAGRQLRSLRSKCHEAFDKIWKTKMALQKVGKGKARGAGYAWLGEQLGIEPADCHFGHMDAETCRRALAIIQPLAARMVEVELEAMRRRRAAEAPQEAF